MRISKLSCLLAFLSFFSSFQILLAQPSDTAAIRRMIIRYKADQRGPYKDIRWYCKDGTNREARDPCPDELGNQRARYKEEVVALAEKEHIFLGQILATTPEEDFWDEANANSRLKQYQLERYLRNVDNGWVNRRAQYYRGAMQDEDETAWGIDFYKWLLSDADNLRKQYFLIRQSVKDVPHAEETNTVQLVRAVSEEIAEAFPSFQDLRIRIHGTPDASLSGLVWDFQDQNKTRMNEAMARKFDQLVCGLEKMFEPFKVKDFESYLKKIPKGSESAVAIANFTSKYPTIDCPPDQCRLISQTSLIIRKDMMQSMISSSRLALLDISNKMESLLNQEFTRWKAAYIVD
ncbi:MAG: phosphoenolpyruvate synthase, partial [Saprospiraceae bacterium]